MMQSADCYMLLASSPRMTTSSSSRWELVALAKSSVPSESRRCPLNGGVTNSDPVDLTVEACWNMVFFLKRTPWLGFHIDIIDIQLCIDILGTLGSLDVTMKHIVGLLCFDQITQSHNSSISAISKCFYVVMKQLALFVWAICFFTKHGSRESHIHWTSVTIPCRQDGHPCAIKSVDMSKTDPEVALAGWADGPYNNVSYVLEKWLGCMNHRSQKMSHLTPLEQNFWCNYSNYIVHQTPMCFHKRWLYVHIFNLHHVISPADSGSTVAFGCVDPLYSSVRFDNQLTWNIFDCSCTSARILFMFHHSFIAVAIVFA